MSRIIFKRRSHGPVPPPPGVLRGQFMLDTRNPFADPKWHLPGALPNRFFMAEMDQLYLHDKPEADRIMGEYVGMGFNHVTAGSVFGYGYHGHFPDTDWLGNPDGYADFLTWLRSYGVDFTLMLLPDCEPYFYGTGIGWNMDLVERDLTPFFSNRRIQSLTNRTCTAWEQYAPIEQMAQAFWWQRQTCPNTKRFWHNPPQHLSPGNSDEDEHECWVSAAHHGIQGLFLQTIPPNDGRYNPATGLDENGMNAVQVAQYDLWDMARRFGLNNEQGPTGEPAGNPWGQPIVQADGSPMHLDYGEGMAFAQYWGMPNGQPITQPQVDQWGTAMGTIEGVTFCLDGSKHT